MLNMNVAKKTKSSTTTSKTNSSTTTNKTKSSTTKATGELHKIHTKDNNSNEISFIMYRKPISERQVVNSNFFTNPDTRENHNSCITGLRRSRYATAEGAVRYRPSWRYDYSPLLMYDYVGVLAESAGDTLYHLCKPDNIGRKATTLAMQMLKHELNGERKIWIFDKMMENNLLRTVYNGTWDKSWGDLEIMDFMWSILLVQAEIEGPEVFSNCRYTNIETAMEIILLAEDEYR